MRSDFVTAMIV